MTIDEKIERDDRDAIEHVLSTNAGRRFLWRILSLCGVYQDINVDDPQEAARKLGQRSIGLLLMQIIGDADQEKLFTMMKEAKSREEDMHNELKKLDDIQNNEIQSINNFI